MKTDIKYQGIGFNSEWIRGFKNEGDFLKGAEPTWFEGDVKRDDKLKELYALSVKQNEKPGK